MKTLTLETQDDIQLLIEVLEKTLVMCSQGGISKEDRATLKKWHKQLKS